MNEKYKEMLKQFEGRKTYDLPDKDQLYLAANIFVCKKAVEDYEFCDPDVFDNHIVNNNEDSTTATVLWLVYYTTTKLDCKHVKYFSVFTKDLPVVEYFALGWIRAACKSQNITAVEDYTAAIKDMILPMKPKFSYWYDRVNLFNIKRFGTPAIDVYKSGDPLTKLYSYTRNVHIKELLLNTNDTSILPERLLGLFNIRAAKTDEAKHRIHSLELMLVKMLFVEYPKETALHMLWNGSICPDAYKFPKSILVEELYCLAYREKQNGFILSDNIMDYSNEDIKRLSDMANDVIMSDTLNYVNYMAFFKLYAMYEGKLLNKPASKDWVYRMIMFRRKCLEDILRSLYNDPNCYVVHDIVGSDYDNIVKEYISFDGNDPHDVYETRCTLYRLAYTTLPNETIEILKEGELTDLTLAVMIKLCTNYTLIKAKKSDDNEFKLLAAFSCWKDREDPDGTFKKLMDKITAEWKEKYYTK